MNERDSHGTRPAVEAMANLRAETGDLVKEMRKVLAMLDEQSAIMADIKGYMKTKLVTRDEFHARMDALEEKRS